MKNGQVNFNMREGIPTTKEYQHAIASPFFTQLENFSDKFLKSNERHLLKYKYKWSKDPFHTWSRQWEYLYVVKNIMEYVSVNNRQTKILDAGSGVTFLPCYIHMKFNETDIVCCDSDLSLTNIVCNIKKSIQNQVKYTISDLRSMPFRNEAFDIICCISVLEHTGGIEDIVGEFKRIMTRKGILIVTFDISLDGKGEITVEGAAKLIGILNKYFPRGSDTSPLDLNAELCRKDIVTTSYFKENKPHLLPWKFPLLSQVKRFIKNGNFSPRIREYTFCCCKYEN
jgi:2-polyprenyl-3-methyl-5-hydroxy-6-metoxy-1,4-benzoquinol methylase